jgi:hypothetical protein
VAIGNASTAALNSVAIGQGVNVNATGSIGIGNDITVAHNSAIGIGYGVTVPASNTVAIGGQNPSSDLAEIWLTIAAQSAANSPIVSLGNSADPANAQLQVYGPVIIGDWAGTAVAGMIRYHSGGFQGYNGSTWTSL